MNYFRVPFSIDDKIGVSEYFPRMQHNFANCSISSDFCGRGTTKTTENEIRFLFQFSSKFA